MVQNRSVMDSRRAVDVFGRAEAAGFGGVLSIPLLSKAGHLIGVTSSHFSGHAKPTDREMDFARVSCDFASDAILELRRRQQQ